MFDEGVGRVEGSFADMQGTKKYLVITLQLFLFQWILGGTVDLILIIVSFREQPLGQQQEGEQGERGTQVGITHGQW